MIGRTHACDARSTISENTATQRAPLLTQPISGNWVARAKERKRQWVKDVRRTLRDWRAGFYTARFSFSMRSFDFGLTPQVGEAIRPVVTGSLVKHLDLSFTLGLAAAIRSAWRRSRP